MRTRLAYWIEMLKSRFWLIPGIVTVLLISLVPLVDALQPFSRTPAWLDWLMGGGTIEGTRLILSSIATAIMTVVGVIFSITVVVLQQVSQQYSPRVIENFIRSKTNQLVLGFFIGTFSYSLLLLRALKPNAVSENAPSEGLGPTVAVILAILCIGVLIYYIHHLSNSIKSHVLLAAITRETIKAIDDMKSDVEREGSPAPSQEPASGFEHEFRYEAERSGYLQEVSWNRIRGILRDMSWHAELLVTAGDYIHKGVPLLAVRTFRETTARQRRRLKKIFKIDIIRTHSQDLRYGIRQMADVALKALSPGINDPTTAIEAVDEIGVVLHHYTATGLHSPRITYPDGSRLDILERPYREYVDLCVNEIALAGRQFQLVERRLEYIVAHAERAARDRGQLEVLRQKRHELRTLVESTPGLPMFHSPAHTWPGGEAS